MSEINIFSLLQSPQLEHLVMLFVMHLFLYTQILPTHLRQALGQSQEVDI